MNRYPGRWLVGAALLAATLLGGLWWVGVDDRFAGQPAAVPVTDPSGFAARRVEAPARSLPAVDVLAHWDRRRAHAYATGDVAALRALYVRGSAAGTADVAMLRSYTRRGLRVEGMRMQLLGVQVLGRGRQRWRLRVTDRLHGAVAVGTGHRLPLPRDRASTRVVTLRLGGGSWKVVSVVTGPAPR
jgi:hypothetical protein